MLTLVVRSLEERQLSHVSYVMIVSPAKKMNVVEGPPYVASLPRFLERTERLMQAVQALSYDEAKALWKCSDKLATLNYERFRSMDLRRSPTAACIAYEGIQYQHLAPQVMSDRELTFLDEHLRILSGFYGVLRPSDGVVPYRLEMQAKLAVDGTRDLYEYWDTSLAQALAQEADTLVNLASVEYAKAVVPHASACGMSMVTCLFGQMVGTRFVQRSTEAKAARGTFARWCAEHEVTDPSDFPRFSDRGYSFDEGRSTPDQLVFVRTA